MSEYLIFYYPLSIMLRVRDYMRESKCYPEAQISLICLLGQVQF